MVLPQGAEDDLARSRTHRPEQTPPRPNPALPDEDEKKLIAALIAISTGVEDVEALGMPVDVGRKLLACYDALGEEPE